MNSHSIYHQWTNSMNGILSIIRHYIESCMESRNTLLATKNFNKNPFNHHLT
ncbi:hypothetical protein KOJCDNHJ_03100 [Xanthomonas citri pv. punicae]|nr:hypothetical protein FICKIIDM_03338 [Xanthomonas citri pv. punicae]UIS29686.1 hypothetical protein KOJCDNHJ_03100 [Xanthomonas citri pv. punicae]